MQDIPPDNILVCVLELSPLLTYNGWNIRTGSNCVFVAGAKPTSVGEVSCEGLSDALSATGWLCLAMAERSLLDIMDCHW